MSRISYLFVFCSLLWLPSDAIGQGLIFRLPEDGSWIRYEGKVKQSDARPEKPEGIEELGWDRHITIRSVGQTQAEFRGQQQQCRWIEIEVVTGQPTEGGIDGPRKIYKVLVPESLVQGQARDPRGVPVTMLPIVKGYKKLGFGEAKPIRAKALQIYPGISVLGHYTNPKVEATGGNPGIGLGAVVADQYAGTFTIERKTTRSKNTAKYWVSKDVPFGIASWNVTMTREAKDLTDPRSAFKQVSLVEVQMKAIEAGNDAEAQIKEN